ncbi:MAG: glycoside hydrolase family 13 protein [Propionibacteriaceae bacterium]|jgi:alpha-glucosidase|nr:glycoside hydrolase family 13 protein [Propionibacteriaceae bacterium]
MALDMNPDWWKTAVVYQIYPRSFADANGDTIGDLAGLTSRVPYLAALGVDAVWLSPFYPSALADGGYDVDDYRDVDPKIGTLAEFDAMTAALHAAGIRLVVDIVPNHSSDRHPWFREALAAAPDSPARDRYIFRDGRGEHGELPPTDFRATFGGPAWTRVADGQWYFHLFAIEQPDFNWDNPEVRADFLTTLRFWADRGVDGFRVDVADGLFKRLPGPGSDYTGDPWTPRDELDRRLDEVYAGWRAVFDEYDPPRCAVGEVWAEPIERRLRFARPDNLGQAFNFDLLRANFRASEFRAIVNRNLVAAAAVGASQTWVLSNHDVVRHATRYGLPLTRPAAPNEFPPPTVVREVEWLKSGGVEPVEDVTLGLSRAKAATAFLLGLPGAAYLYQGEELGLREVADLDAADRQDPTFFRSDGDEIGRDGCRVPLPWTPEGPSFGFGPAGAHLPQPAWFAGYAASVEAADPGSALTLYRELMSRRKQLLTSADSGLTWLDAPDGVLGYARGGGWQVWTNFGDLPAPLPAGEILVATSPVDGTLPPATTVWLHA